MMAVADVEMVTMWVLGVVLGGYGVMVGGSAVVVLVGRGGGGGCFFTRVGGGFGAACLTNVPLKQCSRPILSYT